EPHAEIVKVFCKRCGASANPFSRYCETCGNTLDLSKEGPVKEPAAGEVEKTVITGKLTVPPAAAAFRTQADSPTGRLQASLSDRSQRPAPVESLAEIDRSGRRTVAFNDSLTTNFPAPTDELMSRPTDPSPETVITTLSNPASIGSEQSVQRSDSQGAVVVWMIIATLAVAAGFVAWKLRNDLKNRSLSANSSPSQSLNQSTPQPVTALSGVTPEVAPSPQQPIASNTPNSSPNGALNGAPDGMLFVPGGTFKMGRDDGDEFESPAHTVKV